MIVGVPKEIKDDEFRVAITPSGVHEFVSHGHVVLIEKGAGLGSAIRDEDYSSKGATIVESAREVYERSDLVLKVKEPLPAEYEFLRPGQIVFTYLHLAVEPELTEFLMERGVVAIGYETVQADDGSLPLLAPMSEIAGRMAPQIGAHFLERMNGGRGILLGGVAGVPKAKVVIIGAGMVGRNAAMIAHGLGARVTVVDSNIDKLRTIEEVYGGEIETISSSAYNIEMAVRDADLVIGAVLIPGAKAPYLVTEEMVMQMKEGSVIVDVSIDQGGCVETSRETSHSNPTFVKHGVIHYCVANIPGAVPNTSTIALTNVTIPYALNIADYGLVEAARRFPAIARGINVIEGKITHSYVAQALRKPYYPLSSVMPFDIYEE